jgi:hypothetical protein
VVNPGSAEARLLPPGRYFTKTNIHNFSRCDCVTFRWKVAVGLPLKVGPISDFAEATLCADEALEIGCDQLMHQIGAPAHGHIEGWLVIESPAQLDVVAVYGTAETAEGAVNSFHTERVQPRCMTPCEDFALDVSTGVAYWEVAGPFVGPAPANAVYTEATLGPVDSNWAPLGGALWIHPPGPNSQPEGDYTYRLRFKLCSGFKNPRLNLSALADYYANAYLNGTDLAHLIPPNVTIGPNFSTPIVHPTYASHFKAGLNELFVVVTNREKGTTGLALHGSLVVEKGRCPGEPMPLLACPGIEYNMYLEKFPWEPSSAGGWQGWRQNGQTAGTVGQNRRAEKIKIQLIGAPPGMTISYSVRSAPLIGGAVWQGPVAEGQDVGVLHERIELVQINLINAPLNCHLCYRVYRRHDGWTESWTHEGGQAGSSGENRRVEGMEVKFC